MFGVILIILGIVIISGSAVAAVYLAVLACTMQTIGCATGTATLIVDLMMSGEGIPFCIGIGAGILLLWMGLRIKAQ